MGEEWQAELVTPSAALGAAINGRNRSSFPSTSGRVMEGVGSLEAVVAAVRLDLLRAEDSRVHQHTWRMGAEIMHAIVRRQGRVGKLSTSTYSSQSPPRAFGSSTADEATQRIRN